jgi:regulator of replication initiation timing
MTMLPIQDDYQHLLDENDALRAEIVKLRDRLENCEMIRKEQASYIHGLWEDNRKAHAELRSYRP